MSGRHEETKMNINWYPGHMKKTRELIENNLKAVDIVVEVIDARIPFSGANPMIEEITAGKARHVVLSKTDMADPDATARWIEYFRNRGAEATPVNGLTGHGVEELLKEVKEKTRDVREAKKRPARMMIAGVPNSGKSSLINRMAGRKGARVGDRPGVTTGKQWIKISNGMELLDTPGILWPKFENPKTGLHLAFCGSIKDEIMDTETLALELIRYLDAEHREELFLRYSLSEDKIDDEDPEEEIFDSDGHPVEKKDRGLAVMEAIAVSRGFLMSGARPDIKRTAATVLDEFRSGKIGRMTLEEPELYGDDRG